MMYERPGISFSEAVGLALSVMLILGFAGLDGFFVYWLYTNGYEIWSYITGIFSYFIYLVFVFWKA